MVAPDRNRSGASNSLTLDVPLRVFESEPGVYYVPGTPTDCVHLAISGLFDYEHDMVVSGVNDGANLGDDVLYSGHRGGGDRRPLSRLAHDRGLPVHHAATRRRISRRPRKSPASSWRSCSRRRSSRR